MKRDVSMNRHVSMNRWVRSRAAVVGVVVLLTVAGCGDDGNDVASPSPAAASPTSATVTPAASPAPDGSPATTTAAATEPVRPTGVVIEVRALDNTFRPEIIEVAVGDEVRWVNGGRNEHNALAVGNDDWGVEIDEFQPGDTYSHVFTEPGEYRYYCSIHGTTEIGMVGTVVVTG